MALYQPIKKYVRNDCRYKKLISKIEDNKLTPPFKYNLKTNKLCISQIHCALEVIYTDQNNTSNKHALQKLEDPVLLTNFLTNLVLLHAFENININTAQNIANHCKKFIDKNCQCKQLTKFYKFIQIKIQQWEKQNIETHNNDQKINNS